LALLRVEVVEQTIRFGGGLGIGCVHAHVCPNLPPPDDLGWPVWQLLRKQFCSFPACPQL
jgi:hypothetical protein